MRFGTKVNQAPKGGGISKGFIKYPKDGDTRLRFLEEIDQWTEYWEHFDKAEQKSYPCDSENRDNCKGCIAKKNDPNAWGAQKKLLVNAVLMSGEYSGYVNLWKVPASLKDDLDRFADRDGTITARDYTIIKFKNSEGKVKYSVDREERDSIDMDQYKDKMKDHEQGLIEAYEDVFGPAGYKPGPEEQSQDVSYNEERAPLKVVKDAPSVQVDEEPKKTSWTPEEIDAQRRKDEAAINEQAKYVAEAKAAKAADVPPTEPAQEKDAEQEEENELTEAELRKMSPTQIKALFTQCDFEPPESDDADVLAEALISALR